MSMYNIMHGENPAGRSLLGVLEVRASFNVGRYRDAWVEIDGDRPIIRVHTRNGGGNRDCYCPAEMQREDKHKDGCLTLAIESMQQHPWYLRDADDDFDFTYADFYFAPDLEWLVTERGDEGRIIAETIVRWAEPPIDMGARWKAALDAIKSGERPVPDAVQKVIKDIHDHFEG